MVNPISKWPKKFKTKTGTTEAIVTLEALKKEVLFVNFEILSIIKTGLLAKVRIVGVILA